MPTQTLDPNATTDLPAWLAAVTSLVDQIASWARAEDWSVHRSQAQLSEEGVGSYSVPTLRIRTPKGRNELFVTPVGMRIVGASGRVDLEAWPSLDRVMLIRSANGWRVVTDANVELDRPWGRETFVGVVGDLFASLP